MEDFVANLISIQLMRKFQIELSKIFEIRIRVSPSKIAEKVLFIFLERVVPRFFSKLRLNFKFREVLCAY